MLSATSFIFDGVPCENYNLMLYFFDNNNTVEDAVWNNEIIEDRLYARYDPIFYGININQPATFSLTFGSTEYLSRYEVEEIADWLTSHNSYKWLEICQDDMRDFRYRVIIQNLTAVHINGLPVAFKCDVVCDGQFAYEYPKRFEYTIKDNNIIDKDGHKTTLSSFATIFNNSSYNGYIYPKMSITINDDCDTFSIVNNTDNNNTFTLTSIPNNHSTVSNVYKELVSNWKEAQQFRVKIEDKKNELNKFINEFAGDNSGINATKFNKSTISHYLDLSISQLQTVLNGFIEDVSDDKYWEQYSADSQPLTTNSLRYMVVQRLSDENTYLNSSSTDNTWLDALYSANEDYSYAKYNLISVYNYYYCLKTSDVNLNVWYKLASIQLLKAIWDYKLLNASYITALNNEHNLYDQVQDYSLSGDLESTGDELCVEVDNRNQIMTCNRDNINIYEYFGDKFGNHNFLRLLKGNNKLSFIGSGTVTIECEFLRKVGM